MIRDKFHPVGCHEMPVDMPLQFTPFFFNLHAEYGKEIENLAQNLPVQPVSLVLI